MEEVPQGPRKKIVEASAHQNVLNKAKRARQADMQTLAKKWARERRRKERLEHKMKKLKVMAQSHRKRAEKQRRAEKRMSLFGNRMVINESALEDDFADYNSFSEEEEEADLNSECTDDRVEHMLRVSRTARVKRLAEFVFDSKKLTRNVHSMCVSDGAQFMARCDLIGA